MKKKYYNSIMATMCAWFLLVLPSVVKTTETVCDILNQHGIENDDADTIIRLFDQVDKRNLPAGILYLRLREGISKQVSSRELLSALEHRMKMLKQATELLCVPETRRRHCGMTDECVEIMASALESGLPPDIFKELYPSKPGRAMAQRLRSSIEAAEMLYLAGVKLENIRGFMNDCRDRGVGRMEIIRAAHFWVEKHKQGVDLETIRDGLWEKTSDVRERSREFQRGRHAGTRNSERRALQRRSQTGSTNRPTPRR